MNFEGVKAISIPEGKVKKIECNGVVLWEAKADVELVCAPSVAIYVVKGAFNASSRGYPYTYNATVSGISGELIDKLEIVSEAATGSITVRKTYYASDLGDTVNGYTTPDGSLVQMASIFFAARLQYTDLDGEVKTLETAYTSNGSASVQA